MDVKQALIAFNFVGSISRPRPGGCNMPMYQNRKPRDPVQSLLDLLSSMEKNADPDELW